MGELTGEGVRDYRLIAINLLMAAVRDETPRDILDHLVGEMTVTEFVTLNAAICKVAGAALQVAAGERSEAARVLDVMRTYTAGA